MGTQQQFLGGCSCTEREPLKIIELSAAAAAECRLTQRAVVDDCIFDFGFGEVFKQLRHIYIVEI